MALSLYWAPRYLSLLLLERTGINVIQLKPSCVLESRDNYREDYVCVALLELLYASRRKYLIVRSCKTTQSGSLFFVYLLPLAI